MTDDELKALVAENSMAIRELRASQAESEKQWQEQRQESERQRQESKKQWQEQRQESERQRQESEKRWQEQRQESERQRQESEKQWQESKKQWQEQREESKRQWQEMMRKLDEEIRISRREMDRIAASLNRQVGRLANKLGVYAEFLIRPSLERALREQFKMTVLIGPLRDRRQGETLEVDLVAHGGAKSEEVYVAEIKSRLRPESFDQLYEHIRRFPRFYPEHRGKKFFGILAALEIPEDLKARALGEGIYLATVKDDVFEIVPPDGFEPRAFGLRSLS